jgi:hypothetical protein
MNLKREVMEICGRKITPGFAARIAETQSATPLRPLPGRIFNGSVVGTPLPMYLQRSMS